MLQLFRESGYLKDPSAVTVSALQVHFRVHTEDLDAWVLESLDNRGSPSWYLLEPYLADAGGKWVVGYQPGNRRDLFEHGYEACALYVKRSLEQMRGFDNHAS